MTKLKHWLESDEDIFRNVYKFTFTFSLEPNVKVIKLEDAVVLWNLLFSSKCSFLDQWVSFLQTKNAAFIKMDQWLMFYQLVTETNGNFNNFVDDGAWATIIDEFAVYMAAH